MTVLACAALARAARLSLWATPAFFAPLVPIGTEMGRR
jgi:prolipoprotein diacylglyceryltransferase